jgi:hypothetical protein
LATTLADLHDLGVKHGAIEAAHVLIDEQGRPVLCSFGRAERDIAAVRADVYRREDVQALARLLLACLATATATRLGRALRRAAGSGRQRRWHDARWLARQLAFSVPGARLPNPSRRHDAGRDEEPVRPRRRPVRPVRWPQVRPVWATVVVAGLGLAAVVTGLATNRSPPASASPCPPVDDGCRPVPVPGGIFTGPGGRYALGRPGDIIVLGRWRCGSTALPAVLRPSTGQLWTFATWPRRGEALVGQLAAADLSGAESLRVLSRRSGCDQIEVERGNGPPVIVRIGRS